MNTQHSVSRTLRQAGIGPEWLKADALAKSQTPFRIERATERHQSQSADYPARDVYDLHIRVLAGPDRGASGILSLGKADANGAPYESRAKLFKAVQDGPLGPVTLVKSGSFYAVRDFTGAVPSDDDLPLDQDDGDPIPF